MDAYEATRTVLSRIQRVDPENASKIMGLLLLQGQGDKDMIRLAFGPEAILHSVVVKARHDLGLSSSSSSSSSPSPSPSSTSSSSSLSSLSSWPPPVLDELPLNHPDLFYSDHPDVFNHRRTVSFTDYCDGSAAAAAAAAAAAGGYGWKPCLYYARGFCKNGAACKFLHASPDSSPDFMDHCQELLLRSKTRLSPASQIFSPTSAKCINAANFLGSMMLGDDGNKFGRARIDKNEILCGSAAAMSNAGARQIYLTFPADSTFREEDVSNYFSIYGPVQDVRIPFQQKRMFGFVTFVYPETVKLILAKGNPHFVCDARVLVKPYKEKGKVPDKYRKQQQQQQQIERGELSLSLSLSLSPSPSPSPSPCVTTPPSGFDGRDPFELQHSVQSSSPRLLYNNTHDLIWRRKMEEQAEFQQALELQSRRFMGLQLLDMTKDGSQHRRNLSMGAAPIFSPTTTHPHGFINHLDRIRSKSLQENCLSTGMADSPPCVVGDQKLNSNAHSDQFGGGGINGKDDASDHQDCNAQDSLEHNLPDSPFASPTKRGIDTSSPFSITPIESKQTAATSPSAAPSPLATASTQPPAPFSSGENSLIASSLLPATSTLEMASYNSCLFQMPRFFSGQGAIQM
ncbi:hypothetical protein Sjap_012122 [Stephania japonica]|uniref:Uncharacterized protein n=1 Tax=Stephania japonica TaxID=461633 RepID=A0AAP0IWL2_9MAGN